MEQFQNEMMSIPSFLIQARDNLKGNAKELWVAGIENFRKQFNNLNIIKSKLNLNKYDNITCTLTLVCINHDPGI